jgi:hypothetical protein
LAKGLTKGEASDLISIMFSGMATPQQVQQLEVRDQAVQKLIG